MCKRCCNNSDCSRKFLYPCLFLSSVTSPPTIPTPPPSFHSRRALGVIQSRSCFYTQQQQQQQQDKRVERERSCFSFLFHLIDISCTRRFGVVVTNDKRSTEHVLALLLYSFPPLIQYIHLLVYLLHTYIYINIYITDSFI